LMSLQKPVYRDQFDRLLVEKSINRIQAMALAHEQLYQTNDLSRLDLSSYLSGVIGEIASGNIQVGTDIEVTTKVDPLLLGLELAIPLGIIIYELVNNAIEHGFPEGQRGRIEVRGVVQNDTCGIEVHDDGVGLPEGFDAQRNENLGLLLVQMLSSQLGAKLEFHKDSGTLVRLIFPCPR
ncbi:MAG TPA: sensor histidine kinase, partial [Sediminispirochaeta sp.]|nr:sensor histidine kinase [Sediminispirochaeta sp.]